MAIESAIACKVDIAGVDLIKDSDTKLWYCLEVNNSPQLVTGAFIDEKKNALNHYFKKKLEG